MERSFSSVLPTVVRDTRRRLGWTQARLGAESGVSQSQVSRFEAARIEEISLGTTGRFLDSMGIRARLELDRPFVARKDAQRDPAHARCVAYVAHRLERMGWQVRTEVEIHEGRSHGWLDVVAFEPRTRAGLVGEIKSEIVDFGAVQRALSWYTRAAWDLARSLGWPVRRVGSALLVLATEAADARLTDNVELARRAFPVRAAALFDWLSAPVERLPGPGLALIDPRTRRTHWLISTAADRRRAALRYANYADFMRRVRAS